MSRFVYAKFSVGIKGSEGNTTCESFYLDVVKDLGFDADDHPPLDEVKASLQERFKEWIDSRLVSSLDLNFTDIKAGPPDASREKVQRTKLFITHTIPSKDVERWVQEVNKRLPLDDCQIDWGYTGGRAVVYANRNLSDAEVAIAEAAISLNLPMHDEMFSKAIEVMFEKGLANDFTPPRCWVREENELARKRNEEEIPKTETRIQNLVKKTRYVVFGDVYTLWERYHKNQTYVKSWKDDSPGYAFEIGMIGGEYVWVTCQWANINDRHVAFVTPFSNVANLRMMESWASQKFPDVPQCNQENFHQFLGWSIEGFVNLEK